MNAMIRLVHLALILILSLTGIALGSARGQAPVVGQMVICAGTTTVTVAVDADGQPVRQTHFCPDMALSLIAAVAGTPVAQPLDLPRRIGWAIPTRDGQSRDVPAHSARDPPVPLSQPLNLI